MSEFRIVPMRMDHVDGVVALQRTAFPPPFSENLWWKPAHIKAHIETFPGGQWVALSGSDVIGSCSNCLIGEESWLAHLGWGDTVGGPYIRNHAQDGSTLYGLDITVHPEFRRQGIARAFYETRFELVREQHLTRYGTGCRIPDYRAYSITNPETTVEQYVQAVAQGRTRDRTLTPLLRMGVAVCGVVQDYMEDMESANYGVLLEWKP